MMGYSEKNTVSELIADGKSASEQVLENSDGQFLIYESDSGTIEVWLSQVQLAELFGTKRPAITKDLGNIFNSNELEKNSVCSILEHTALDGKCYKIQHYLLDNNINQ